MNGKKVFFFLATVLATGLFLTAAAPAHAYTYTWYSYGGNQYALTENSGGWSAAEAEAVSQGGYLATITDAGQVTWLTSTFNGVYGNNDSSTPGMALFWIGLENPTGDLGNKNAWVWSSGSTSTYWQTIGYIGDGWNFPEAASAAPYPSGPYAYLHTNPNPEAGYINNATLTAYGVIERSTVPVPAGILLLGPGLVGLAATRRRFKK
jgi:hypothetical protein